MKFIKLVSGFAVVVLHGCDPQKQVTVTAPEIPEVDIVSENKKSKGNQSRKTKITKARSAQSDVWPNKWPKKLPSTTTYSETMLGSYKYEDDPFKHAAHAFEEFGGILIDVYFFRSGQNCKYFTHLEEASNIKRGIAGRIITDEATGIEFGGKMESAIQNFKEGALTGFEGNKGYGKRRFAWLKPVPDPPLSSHGVEQALDHKLAQSQYYSVFSNIGVVLASELQRAWMTASFIYPDHRITTVPFLRPQDSEDVDNMPRKWDPVLEHFKGKVTVKIEKKLPLPKRNIFDIYPEYRDCRVQEQVKRMSNVRRNECYRLSQIDISNTYQRDDSKGASEATKYQEFKRYLFGTLLPARDDKNPQMDTLSLNLDGVKTIRDMRALKKMAIFTHSEWMDKFIRPFAQLPEKFPFSSDKVLHNQAYLVRYRLQRKEHEDGVSYSVIEHHDNFIPRKNIETLVDLQNNLLRHRGAFEHAFRDSRLTMQDPNAWQYEDLYEHPKYGIPKSYEDWQLRNEQQNRNKPRQQYEAEMRLWNKHWAAKHDLAWAKAAFTNMQQFRTSRTWLSEVDHCVPEVLVNTEDPTIDKFWGMVNFHKVGKELLGEGKMMPGGGLISSDVINSQWTDQERLQRKAYGKTKFNQMVKENNGRITKEGIKYQEQQSDD